MYMCFACVTALQHAQMFTTVPGDGMHTHVGHMGSSCIVVAEP